MTTRHFAAAEGDTLLQVTGLTKVFGQGQLAVSAVTDVDLPALRAHEAPPS